MSRKLFCLCAAATLLVAFATANVASAQEAVPALPPMAPMAAPAACPCVFPAAPQFVCPVRACNPCAWNPCVVTWQVRPWHVNPCMPPVAYRIGPLGAIRPVVYAPVVRPVVVVPRVHRWHHPVYVHPGFAW